jgi:hypothetical protein
MEEYRVSMEEIDVKLLLHHPEEHAKFDETLLALLQSLRGSDDHETRAKKGREIIESVTDEQPGNFCLIRQTWRDDWNSHPDGRVMTGWFDDRDIEDANRKDEKSEKFRKRRVCWCGHRFDTKDAHDRDEHRRCGERIVEALHTAITGMVKFVLDAKTPYTQQECRTELIKALTLYLEKRGKDVMKHPDGPEGRRWLWWDGVRHKVCKGRVYDLLAFMWARDRASFDDLIQNVFESSVSSSNITSAVNRVNNELRGIRGFPRKLTTDCVNRLVCWEEKT